MSDHTKTGDGDIGILVEPMAAFAVFLTICSEYPQMIYHVRRGFWKDEIHLYITILTLVV